VPDFLSAMKESKRREIQAIADNIVSSRDMLTLVAQISPQANSEAHSRQDVIAHLETVKLEAAKRTLTSTSAVSYL
jgi:hypothetical protein